MRESDHDIDKLFGTHFEDFEVKVTDKEGLWRRINPDRSNRKFLLLMFIGVVAASSLMLAWTIDEIEYSREAAGGGSEDTIINSLYIENAPEDQGHSNEELTERIEAILEKVDEGIDDKATIREGLEPIHNRSKSKETVKEQKQKNFEIEKAEEKNDELENSHPYRKELNALRVFDTEATGYNQELEEVSFDESQKVNKEQGEPDKSVSIADKTILRKQTLILSDIAPLSIKSLDDQSAILDELSDNKLVCSMTSTRGFGSGHLFLDVYSSFGLPIDNVSLQSGSEDEQDYLALWNDRYQSLSSISGGVMIGYSMNNGLEISAGGEYQLIESQYRTTQRVTEIIRVYDPMAYFFTDDDGNTVWVADSVSAVSVYDRTTSIANRSTLLSVPFQLSYPIYQKGVWQVRAVGGGAFNFSLEHRGQHLRSNQQLVQLDDNNRNNFISPRIGVSIEAGLQFGTFVGERLELYASPRYRYNRQSYLVSTEAISVARDFIGLRVGAKYHLD